MAGVEICCEYCGEKSIKPRGHVSRAHRLNRKIYCGKACSGSARRSSLSLAERKARKSEYDSAYRSKNKISLAKKKSEYFRKTYDPVSASKERAKIKKERPEIEDSRREYMKGEEYVAKKKRYDRRYRAIKNYGPEWGDCMVVALNLRDECLSQSSDYEIRLQSGTLSKSQKRKRDYERLNSKKSEIGPLGYAK